MNVVAAMNAAGSYGSFVEALEAANLLMTLEGAGPFTVFAPNDAAFAREQQSLSKLLIGDPKRLRAVMGYHFAKGKVLAARFAGKRIRATTFSGASVLIDGQLDGLLMNGVACSEPDMMAHNGVIHGIDGVLWPKAATVAAA